MRYAGILLHLSSLAGEYGIGTLGLESYRFVDFLATANQKYWQILPIGPTSFGDSPYQSFSVFAGNPYFIDFELLQKDNLLEENDYKHLKTKANKIDYHKLFTTRFIVLTKAYKRFKQQEQDFLYKEFVNKNHDWLIDYALFMSLKEHFNYQSWQDWPEEFKDCTSHSVIKFYHHNIDRVNFWIYVQYQFFKQWQDLKKYANQKGVEIIGDMPIYASLDSADCWANPQYFKLDDFYRPRVVAGVPPDLFSKTGQLWGNPLYDYDRMQEDNYRWWKRRIEVSQKLFDLIRIDHFRGFEAYYQIPSSSKTAQTGSWVKGPGLKLFQEIRKDLGEVRVIAEDLGFITDDVRTLRKETNFPGMRVLQFGFDKDHDSEHAPHNLEKNCVIYPGTHDNPPIKAWYQSLSKADKEYVNTYLHISSDDNICEAIIRECLKSVCQIAIIPMQDYLELGDEGRMNTPSIPSGNWKYRLSKKDLTNKLARKIKVLTIVYKRSFHS